MSPLVELCAALRRRCHVVGWDKGGGSLRAHHALRVVRDRKRDEA